ncbi:MAG: hypothetical protein JO250_09310 [Armatimonadetes bacterium]|nr:hypothetical protein [Armatimonadota bacterium]
MECPHCGYVFGPFETECVRCKSHAGQGAAPPPVGEVKRRLREEQQRMQEQMRREEAERLAGEEAARQQERRALIEAHRLELTELVRQFRDAQGRRGGAMVLSMFVPMAGFYSGTQADEAMRRIRLEVARLGVDWEEFKVFAETIR